MNKIDLFVDHFVIHSESREALILNGSVENFKSNLRELVSSEVRNVLLEHVEVYDEVLSRSDPFTKVTLVPVEIIAARDALMDLHNSLL